MDCDEARQLVDAYALGVLERPEARRLEGHLSRCADCLSLSHEAAEVASLLALSAPQRRAAPALHLRLMARLGAAAARRRAWAPSLWTAAAAVLLAASLGAIGWGAFLQNRVNDLESDKSRLASLIDEGRQRQADLVGTQEAIRSQELEMELALAAALDYEARTYDMLGAGPAVEARARYVWSAQHDLGVLYADRMPPPPSGMTYQLWLVTEEQAVDGGTFTPAQDGSARLLVPHLGLQAPVIDVRVSLEPEGGSDTPSGATVLRGEPSEGE